MNKAALHWLRLAALCPLAAIGLGWSAALLLAGVLALTLLAVDTGLLALRKWWTNDQQPIIAALLAAIVTGAANLILQAICHTQAQTLQPYLPLPIVVAVLFCRGDVASSFTNVLRSAVSRGTAFGAALMMGAGLHAMLPADARIAASLIVCGLVLAIVARVAPVETETISTRRPRARVTGPLR
jgi:Na+-translocating ferredoxin:NAD+ oxidoreductase RnfE subunit